MEEKKPIKIGINLKVGYNPHGIPPNSFIDVEITITDEYEIIRTSNSKFTQDLVKVAPKFAIANYSARLQKAIIKFPGWTQDKINNYVLEDLKKLPQGYIK